MTTETAIRTAKGNVEISPRRGDVRAAMRVYLGQCDLMPKSVSVYARALEQFAKWADSTGTDALDASRADILTFKRDLEDGGKSASTVNAYLSAVRGFYRWVSDITGRVNPAANVRGERKRANVGRDALTVEQAKGVIKLDGETEAALRDAAIINLMTRRGLRTVEVSRADVGDVRTVDGVPVLWVQGKGHAAKDDFVLLGSDCVELIDRYLSARKANGGDVSDGSPLFCSNSNHNHGGRISTRTVSRIVKAAYEREGISSPRITAHSLRHTAVTLALKSGATVQEAQAMARHADISTTMIYAHNLERTEGHAERGIDALLSQEL